MGGIMSWIKHILNSSKGLSVLLSPYQLKSLLNIYYLVSGCMDKIIFQSCSWFFKMKITSIHGILMPPNVFDETNRSWGLST